MDDRLKITDALREVPPGIVAETPLVTLAWRALRAEHQRRAEERKRDNAEVQQLLETLAVIAEVVYRLRGVVRSSVPILEQTGGQNDARQLAAIADQIEEALAAADVTIVAPEGERYTAERMELLDNVAQRPEPETLEPRVAEVITPAILYRSTLLRAGKAVIAVPLKGEET